MRLRFTALRMWLVSASVAALIAACGPASTPPPGGGANQPASQSAGQPAASGQPATVKRGGTFTRPAGASSFGGVDPAMGQQGYQVWPIMGEYLLRVEPETWKLLPGVIEQWQYSADGLTLTLNLRKGMKFHNKPPVNGREVEAKDVVYTLKTISGILYPQLPTVRFPRRSQYEQIGDAVAVDKYTVKVTLTEPSATLLQGLAEYRSAVVLPEGLREAFGGVDSLTTPDPQRFISTGPFILTKFVQLTEATYERNPEYWDKGVDGKSKPYLDQVREIFIADAGTEVAALIAGQLSYRTIANPDDRDLVLSQRPDMQVMTYAPSSCWYRIAFNLQRKPFDDVRVRKAIQLVLNPSETGTQMYGEWQGKPLWRYPSPLPWVFPESLPQEELAKLPGNRLPKDQDIAEARRLLKEAGLENGFAFEMVGSASATTRDGVQLAQRQIEKALPGIKLTPKLVDNAINHQVTAEGNFDAQYYCYIHEATAVAMMKTPYHTKGGRNYPRFSDPKMDDLLDRAGRELDDEKRTKLLHEAQMYALEVVPFAPTFHYAMQMGVQPQVRGMRFGAATVERAWFGDVWLDQ